ncbi:MAG: phosphoribosyltransferase [Planctomycetota bacterium]|jgi:hypoxanthine phosphoribosyltransferase
MSGNGARCQCPALPALVSKDEIGGCVRDLAAAITRDHPADEGLVIVAIMKGALVFLADLMRHLQMPLEIELVGARSYRGARQQEKVEVLDDVGSVPLRGRHVLLLDCVLDSGRTLSAVREALAARAPASLKTCVLLSKERRREVAIAPEYVGRHIPHVFVIGYGLDCENRWRHLPYVTRLPACGDNEGGPA